jgi:hypothetical protein
MIQKGKKVKKVSNTEEGLSKMRCQPTTGFEFGSEGSERE